MSDSQQHHTDRRTPEGGDASMDGLARGRAWLVGGAFGVLVLAALIVAFVIGTNYSDDPTPVVDATKTTTPELPKDTTTGPGKEIFATHCGACHTLAEAGTTGTIGPDLDTVAPDVQTVRDAITNGGTGSGMMPAGLVSGEDLTQVADFVSAATGGG